MAASYIADMMDKMKVELVSDGDLITEGISIIDTPGHTKGHIGVLIDMDGENVLVSGDALPDGGFVRRGMPYNIFWDVKQATDSMEKMLDASQVFYPGHDRPFRLEGDQISYLHGPTQIEVLNWNEAGGSAGLTFKVYAHRSPNIDPHQKG